MSEARVAITIPEGVSLTSDEISLGTWLKKPGDPVKRGEPIVEILTDKATLEIEATESGTLDEIVVEEGTELKVGVTIGWLVIDR
jgi:pyruvate/2-oxoglutarate dehydrogenase complex dihydrolipoamide acyltransferase (E2) component